MTDESSVGMERSRVVCVGCGKAVSGKQVRPGNRCHDCGKQFVQATPEKLACGRCGAEDASSVMNSDHNRLCDDCIDYENRDNPKCPECGRRMIPNGAKVWECPDCWNPSLDPGTDHPTEGQR